MKIYRLAIILFISSILAFLLHLIIYKMNFDLESIINVLFVVGVITFLPAILVITNALTVFDGIKYALRVFITPSYRTKYPTFKDYKEDCKEKIKSKVFMEILIVSAAFLLVSTILTVIYHVNWEES